MIKKLTLAVLVLVALACGGGGGGGGGSVGGSHGVTLNTYSANLAFSQNLHLTATVPGVSVQTVTWTRTGGSITPISATDAVYTSPSVAGSYTITATSVSEPSKYATCVVNVSQVGITIDPTARTMNPSSTASFKGTVTGSTNTTVNFTASGGTLVKTSADTANYTAPSSLGSYTVTATSAADPSKQATATVTVANVGASATISGQVIRTGSAVGVGSIIVAFYNASGAELARATTGADGRFSTLVPITARRFHLISSSLGTAFYQQYEFSTLRYSILVTSCTAPLPTLTTGGSFPLASPIELTPSTDPPPPPPNGCG